MSDLSIELKWELGEHEFSSGKYLTDHRIKINEHISFLGSSASSYGGNINHMNPEQALAVAMSSCHMMTFLALASKMKWPVVKYSDEAKAFIGKNSKGKMCVNKIELNPKIIFDNNFSVPNEEMIKMQDRAHRYCFVANSLSDEVEVVIN